MSFSLCVRKIHFHGQLRGFTASDPKIWHERRNDGTNLKHNIEIENIAAVDHL